MSSPAEQSNQTKNALGIAYVTGGPPKLRAKLNAIIAGMNMLILRNSADIIGDVSSLGTLARFRNNIPASGTRSSEPKTFFVTAADTATATRVNVTAGAINSEIYDGTFTPPGLIDPYTVANGYKVWLEVDWDTDGVTVILIDVGVGSSMPANDGITSYTLLATVAVTSGATKVTPLAWNYSQAQACGKDGDGKLVVSYW